MKRRNQVFPKERIRILVDRSLDSEWSGELVDMEPDTVYWATDNRDYLSWSVLKNYDVLIICGCSPLDGKGERGKRKVRKNQDSFFLGLFRILLFLLALP